MSTENQSYTQLEKTFREISYLDHTSAILSWDEQVMMPDGGGNSRAEVMAYIAGLTSQKLKNPEVLKQISEAEKNNDSLNEWQSANLREMRRQFLRFSALPQELIEKQTLTAAKAQQAWRDLRAKNDWATFEPILTEVVKLAREAAVHLSQVYDKKPYDALIHQYEPGMSVAEINPIFAELKSFLPDFIKECVERQKNEIVLPIEGEFPVPIQRELGLELMKDMGFNFNHGRLDVSHHPFCGGVAQDVRLTTRYYENSFSESLMGVLHETGHAKYEQNRPADWLSQPVGDYRSMSVHESQSLLHEMQVGRSRGFQSYITPLAEKYMRRYASPDCQTPKHWSEENFYRIFTRVKPDFIRTSADEVTYPLHIILRYELEQGLIDGSIQVRDLPALWNEYMEKFFGISTLGNDKNGVMQDVHWPSGAFGYFPSYTLGAMIAAQVFAKARQDQPTIETELRTGNFTTLNQWLKEKIWSKGSLYGNKDLIQKASGEVLNPHHFKKHLLSRFSQSH
jgi:carboxypeptidase Taq